MPVSGTEFQGAQVTLGQQCHNLVNHITWKMETFHEPRPWIFHHLLAPTPRHQSYPNSQPPQDEP